MFLSVSEEKHISVYKVFKKSPNHLYQIVHESDVFLSQFSITLHRFFNACQCKYFFLFFTEVKLVYNIVSGVQHNSSIFIYTTNSFPQQVLLPTVTIQLISFTHFSHAPTSFPSNNHHCVLCIYELGLV